jgi:uncharacterized protein (TIGR00730 family)
MTTLQPEENVMQRICVFCGSNPGAKPIYTEAAKALGMALVRNGIELVYGGGRVGLMGTIATTVMEAGGRVIGVIPKGLADVEIAHQNLTELHIVKSMHERKAMMADYADGFIAMPGGYGTMEEFCEIVTWTQLGIHRKACGIFNVDGFYDGFLTFVRHAVQEAFISPIHGDIIITGTDPDDLIKRIITYTPAFTPKWLDRSET